MTVNTTNITSGPYIGNNVTDTFSYTFRIKDKSQVKVYETDVAGGETLLAVDTDYTVSGIGVDGGGSILRIAGPLPTGAEWYIRSNYIENQLTAFSSQGGFFPDVHEDQMDHLTFLIQQLRDSLSRSAAVGDSYSGALPLTLPDPESLQILRWRGDLTGLENIDPSSILPGSFVESDFIRKVVTVAAMKADASIGVDQLVFCIEHTAGKGTDGGNVYFSRAVTAATDDNGSVIKSTAVPSIEFVGLFVTGQANVKQFGALADGTDDSTAFLAASAFYESPLITPGSYLVDSPVPGTFQTMGTVVITGDGGVRVRSLSEIAVTPIEGNDKQTLKRKMAENDNTIFPYKNYATAAWLELLRLSPNVTVFERSSDGAANYMTELYIREVIREMASAGIRSAIVPYVEYLSFWFYQPGFSFPTDHDTSQTGAFWKTLLPGYPNVDNFNPVEVILSECEKQDMHVYLGLGRNGDTALTGDLLSYWDGVTGNPAGGADPVRYGLTLTTRLTNAQDRTREVAADLIAQFNNYDSFHGFYISHEPGEFEFSNQYTGNVTLVSGTDLSLRSYGKPIMIGPPSPADLAATSTFAQRLIDSGCDIFSAQDSVGPGNDLINARYTWVPALTRSQLDAHFTIWRGAIDIANAISITSTRQIRLWANVESWQMGETHAVTLTLSATSGAAVTATAAGAAFVAGDVGRFLTDWDGGRAKITGFTSTTVVTIDTTYTGEISIADGTAFSGTAILSGAWATSDGYQNDYPAPWWRVLDQMQKVFPWVDAVADYAWLGFRDSGVASLRPAQTNSSQTAFRTAALALYASHAGYVAGQQLKYENEQGESIIQHRLYRRGSAAAATSLTDDFANFYPKSDSSRLVVKYYIRGTGAFGTTTVTFNVRINSINVESTQVLTTGYAHAPPTMIREVRPQGVAQIFGISFSTTSSIDFTLGSADIEVLEFL